MQRLLLEIVISYLLLMRPGWKEFLSGFFMALAGEEVETQHMLMNCG
jgi:hypothetical protein